MSLADTPLYISDINSLKDKFKGTIDIFLGLEIDYFTEVVPEGLDYIIGTVHHVERFGNYVTIDGPPERFYQMVTGHFDGDYYTVAESYFKHAADLVLKIDVDIVGHFDLVTKNNTNGSIFDVMHPRYIDAAISSMEQILKKCRLFEVNTGAMFRRGTPEPYPSVFLLKELQKRGGEVILSSDSHVAESLFYKYDEMLELVKSCGYKYIKKLTKDGFVDEKI